jgi:hypothetical protein
MVFDRPVELAALSGPTINAISGSSQRSGLFERQYSSTLAVIAEPGIDAGGVGAAATMLGAIGELDDICVILDSAEFKDARQADNPRTVNTGKPGGIEAQLKRLHSFAKQMNPCSRVEF